MLHPDEACRRTIEQRFIVHRADPLIRETSIAALIDDVATTHTGFYVRNHFQIPQLDAGTWRLNVGGLVNRPQVLTLRDLRHMRSQTRTITLECAGNGRARFDPPTEGVPWGLGAVSTAEWTGILLAEVLDRAGVRSRAREVIFRGADSGEVSGLRGIARYERSLKLDDATAPGVLLAYAMNGKPLPALHGYPLRLMVPGWYGMAAVKWLTDIQITDRAFVGPYQTGDYYYEWSRDGQVVREPVNLQRVRSLIITPSPGAQIGGGELAIRGVAWSGAAPIARVEISIGDRPWQDAQLCAVRHHYSWQRWESITQVGCGETTIRARATDFAGYTQPETPEWNRLGYGNNAIHEVTVLVTK